MWQVLSALAITAVVYSFISGAEGKKNIEVPKSLPNPLLTDNLQVTLPENLTVNTLYAKNFSLRDDQGRERISMQVLADGSPTIVMRDEEGRAKSYWTISSDGQSQLAMLNSEGREVALISEHPKKDGGLVRISNNQGKIVTAITTDAEGNGMLSVTKSDGSRPIGLGYW